MKRLFLTAALFLLLSVLTAGAMDLGLGVDFSVYSETEKLNDYTANYSRYYLEPTLIIRMSEKMEIDPHAIISYGVWSDPDSFSLITDDETQLGVGGGVSVLFRLIPLKYVDFQFGIKGEFINNFEPEGDSATDYDSYSDFWIQVFAPVVMDVKLRKNVFLRIKHEVIVFIMHNEKTELGGVTNDDTVITFTDYENSNLGSFQLYFGLYFML